MDNAAHQIIDLYRRHAKTWSDKRRKSAFQTLWFDRFLQLVPTGGHILDLGCGPAFPVGRYLVDQGVHLTGVDSAPEMLAIARENVPEANFVQADMRRFELDQQFDGILAWDSFFHLNHADQEAMFGVFQKHAATGSALMFTSGPDHGIAMGTLEGEPLYHASLAPQTYRATLLANGFEVIRHMAEDPDCGGHTIWLAKRTV